MQRDDQPTMETKLEEIAAKLKPQLRLPYAELQALAVL
jgi:hypothetical protein